MKKILSVLLLLVPVAGLAQDLQELDVQQAVRVALEHNREYKAANLRVEQADAQVAEVWGQYLPALDSEASAMRQGAENGFMSLSDGQYDLKLVQLKFGVNPGASWHALQSSYQVKQAAAADLRRVRADIENRVVHACFGLLLAEEMQSLREESVVVLRQNIRDVESMFTSGSVPRFDVLQARVQLDQAEVDLLEARNARSLALDMFNHELGQQENRYCARRDILDAAKCRRPAIDAEPLLSAALGNRPEVIVLESKAAGIREAAAAQGSVRFWPTFTVGGYYGKTMLLPNEVSMGGLPGGMSIDMSGLTGKEEWQDTWQVRAAATWRWSSWLPWDSSRSAERKMRLQAEEQDEMAYAVRERIVIAVRAAHGRLYTSWQSVQAREHTVETAREGLRIARESFRAGVVRNNDLLNAELAYTRARSAMVKAIHDYYLGLADLKRETGIIDEQELLEEVQ